MEVATKHYVDQHASTGIFYGTCSTAMNTGEKAVVCSSFNSSNLVAGAMINVKFDYACGSSTLKLNVNSTGAKNIAIKGYSTLSINNSLWRAGEVVGFVYDGTNWTVDRSPEVSGAKGIETTLQSNGIVTVQNDRYTHTLTLSSGGWTSDEQIVSSVTGCTSNSIVFISPDPTSSDDYVDAGILCTAQGNQTLTFTCKTVPTNNITVNVVIWN